MPSDTQMDPRVQPKPIEQIAAQLGIDRTDLLPYGREIAKIHLNALYRPRKKQGRLILVSATTPTAAGE